MTKLNTVLVATAAGALVAAACAGRAEAGWFGLGESGKSKGANEAARNDVYDPNQIAHGPQSASSATKKAGGWNFFGLGKQSSTTQSKGNSIFSGSKAKTSDKGETSWWSSWWKPKEPSPPKDPKEWMRLKPVRWGAPD